MLVKKLVSGCKWISCIDVHPSGDHLIVGSYDRRVAWFDLDLSSTPYKTLKYHTKVTDLTCYRRDQCSETTLDQTTPALVSCPALGRISSSFVDPCCCLFLSLSLWSIARPTYCHELLGAIILEAAARWTRSLVRKAHVST